MKTVKIIRLGQPTVEVPVEDGTTIGAVLTSAGVTAEGRTLTFNGSEVTQATSVTADGNLLLAAQTKGGE